MRILLVHPNNYLNIGIPTGLATLAAVLKQRGLVVDLFDFTFVKTASSVKRPLNVNPGIYLPTVYTLEDLVVDDPVQSLAEAFSAKLKAFKPDLIAISAMTSYFDEVIDLLRQVPPRCPVIVGGVHSTICPKDVLLKKEIDFICVGEGEELLVELSYCLAKGGNFTELENLGYKKNGRIFINRCRPFIDLNILPEPDWSLFDQRHLFRPFMGRVYRGSFYTMSRGCPGQCTYCVNGAMREALKDCGRYFRFQSPATTARQLGYLKEHYGATWFKFADDSIMLFNEQYLEELAERLEPLSIQFGCSVRPETTTERKVKLLKRMGCVAASVGIESGNEALRKRVLNRYMSNQKIKQAVEILKNAGIRVSTFNMIGLPGETRKNVFETISLNKKLKVEAANVYIVYPYPGTVLSWQYKTKFRDATGKIIPVSRASSFAFSTMSPTEVEGLLATFDLYLRLPEKKWPQIRKAEGSCSAAIRLRQQLYEQAVNI
ncbi:MAG: radical SAM protein [Patescibacteria group bacterium]